MKDYKRTDINKNLWVCDYGNGTFEIFIRACGPTGAYVYRYEKERLKWCQRRSYGGASTPKYYNFLNQIINLIGFYKNASPICQNNL